jgi:polysaccharide biosynthesis transport protein
VLVDLGYLSESDVARALTIQEESPMGIMEALSGENIDDCLADTGIAGLSILPLGGAQPTDVSRVSPQAVRGLIARLREKFDTVIIDTGPIPGSLEASVVAAAVDGVVLVVSRGEHRPLAERSIQHLRDIGAPLAGMVFNRAEGRDIDLNSTTNRISSVDRASRGSIRSVRTVNSTDSQTLGPVALAVANRAQPGNNNNAAQP